MNGPRRTRSAYFPVKMELEESVAPPPLPPPTIIGESQACSNLSVAAGASAAAATAAAASRGEKRDSSDIVASTRPATRAARSRAPAVNRPEVGPGGATTAVTPTSSGAGGGRGCRRTIKKDPNSFEGGGEQPTAAASVAAANPAKERRRGGEASSKTTVAPKRRRTRVSWSAVVKKEEEEEEMESKALLERLEPAAVHAVNNNASSGNDLKTVKRSPPGGGGGGGMVEGSAAPQNQQKRKKKAGRRSLKTEVKVEGRRRPDLKEVPPRLAQKAALIVQVMDALYPDPPIPINHVDSFTLLCGVLLSAQTTDGQVNEVTKELFRVAPDPQSLARMSHEKLQQIIRSVGLAPTKAKHLIALSQQLLERFDGRVPDTFEGLQSLPGVGRKTAAVVMVQAFGTPAFPVDTHIHRLALRWGLTTNEKNASKVEEDLMAVFPRESWAKLHLQFIYFGREHCQARMHQPSSCPVCCWIKKTGPGAPTAMADLSCLRDYLACPTPPKKSSKNAIVYSERLLEIEQFRMKMAPN